MNMQRCNHRLDHASAARVPATDARFRGWHENFVFAQTVMGITTKPYERRPKEASPPT